MMLSRRIQREAREAVIATRFRGAPPPANPYRPGTQSRIWWDMGHRRAEKAIGDLMQVGA